MTSNTRILTRSRLTTVSEVDEGDQTGAYERFSSSWCAEVLSYCYLAHETIIERTHKLNERLVKCGCECVKM